MILFAASRIHNTLAATQSAGLYGIASSPRLHRMAPTRKNGVRRPPARDSTIAPRADDRLVDQAGHRTREPQQRQRRLVDAEVAVDWFHIGLLEAEAELQGDGADVHVDDRQCRMSRIVVLVGHADQQPVWRSGRRERGAFISSTTCAVMQTIATRPDRQ